MAMSDDERLGAIRARCEAASSSRAGDQDFIEHAWEDVPWLLGLLRDEREAHRQTLYLLEAATVEAASQGMVRGTESLREWIGGYVATLKADKRRLELLIAKADAVVDYLDDVRPGSYASVSYRVARGELAR